MLAKAIVRESGVIFINTRISNLISKWFDDAQKLGEYRLNNDDLKLLLCYSKTCCHPLIMLSEFSFTLIMEARKYFVNILN
jgi:hypothetical protein